MSISFARRMGGVRPSAIRELLKHGADPDLISFGGGYPDQRLFPLDDLRAVYDGLLHPDNAATLQYTTSDGLPSLRRAIAERMTTQGTPMEADDVLVLNGGQQGLDLVAKLLIDPGDTIIVEDPTFLGALIAFAPMEARYAAVRVDDDGMDVEHLAEVLRDNPGAKMIYTVPDFHNPTGVTMSLERRRRLIELANRFDVLVLEDSPYRELRFEGEPVPTLRSLDTEGRVVHLSSFSKILAPGMRLGWLAADASIREKLALLKLAADTQSGTLSMAAASAYISRFDLDAHVGRLREAYRGKRDLMIRTLDESFPESVARTYPRGGLFTWLTFPSHFDSARFMADVALPSAKVAYVPGATFFAVDPRTNHARINFSNVSEEHIVTGIARLGIELHKELSA
jgi:2-aminoadipate transaminase